MVSLYFGLSAHHQESEKTEYKFEKCLQMKIFNKKNNILTKKKNFLLTILLL